MLSLTTSFKSNLRTFLKKLSCSAEWAKAVIVNTSVLFLFLLFNAKITTFFNEAIVPILSSVNEGYFSSILFFALFLALSIFWYKKFKHNYYVAPFYCLSSVLLAFIYGYYRFFTSDYIIIVSDLLRIGFSDIIFGWLFCFGIISFIIDVKDVKQAKKTDNANTGTEHENKDAIDMLEEDAPITRRSEDILAFGVDVDRLFYDIEHRKNNSSFSIGINAKWGCGKSSFINLLAEKFRENEGRYVLIRFNPRYANNSSIQSSFFEMFFSELSKYDSRFKSSFNDYLKVIDVMAENKLVSAILQTTKLVNRVNEKEKINRAIKRLKKRIVVIVEDLDRLTTDEITEVFKLIDGNASFNNLFFICAYDKERIQSLFVSEKDSNAYSDKFFTLERQLPLRSWNLLLRYLTEHMVMGLNLQDDDSEEIVNTIRNNYSLFKSYLDKLRDIKRYINLVKPFLKGIQKEVNVRDYLLLGLIRYKYPHEYEMLYKENSYKDNRTNFEFSITSNHAITIDNEDKYESKDVLAILFPNDCNTSFRSINSIGSFSIYFHDYLFGNLSMERLRLLFKTNVDYKTIIKKILDEKHGDVLIEYLGSLDVLSLPSWDAVINYLDIYIHLTARYEEQLYSTINVGLLLEKRITENLCKKYSLRLEDYKSTLYQRLIGEYPEYPFEISKQQLWAYKSRKLTTTLIFSEDELLDILKNSLQDLIKHKPEYTKLHYGILRACIASIDTNTRKASLDTEACELVLHAIERKPDEYINNFVFLGAVSSSPDWNNITCDQCWRQIFGDHNKMKSFIDDSKLDSITNIERVRNFWELYENNGYEPIEFENQGSVQDKISSNLVTEHKMLDEIHSIESQAKLITPSQETLVSSFGQIRNLLERLNANTLYIKKRKEVLTLIENKFNELEHLKESASPMLHEDDNVTIQLCEKYFTEHFLG